jgi:hypothetical protein
MFARTAALGKISTRDVSDAYVGRSVGDNSQDYPPNAHDVGSYLLQFWVQIPPRV